MSKNHRIILFFALIKFLIPFVLIHPAFQLHRDEYLYMADARHLAWGFVEMPPLLAVLGHISWLAGGSYFTVYFWGALFGALTMWIIGKMVIALRGGSYAVFIACLGFLISGFLRIHILFQPNFLDTFFWTLSTYFIICWINTDSRKYLYYIGLCFGLGMLSKYTMAFYILGFWVGMLVTVRRKWLRSRDFYFAMFLAFIIALPNFVWQVREHFPVMHHMQLLQDQQLQYLSRIQFMIEQLTMTLPSCFVWLMALWFLFARSQGRPYIMVGVIYLVILSVLLFFRGKGYYAISIYPSLIAIGSVFLEMKLDLGGHIRMAWLAPALIIVLGIPFIPIAVPFTSPQNLEKIYKVTGASSSGLLRWEDGKSHPLPQDFSDMLGWDQMASLVSSAYQQLDSSEKAHTLIFCDNYGQAGAVNYFAKKYGLPQAHAVSASFLYWLPSPLHVDNLILVTDDQQEMQHDFIKDFASARVTGTVSEHYAREKGALVILMKGANEAFNQMMAVKVQRAWAELK